MKRYIIFAVAVISLASAAWSVAQIVTGNSGFGTTSAGGLITPSLQPATDSTTAIRIFKADGVTCIGAVDTTNARFNLGGCAAPSDTFTVNNQFVVSGGGSGTFKNTLMDAGYTTSNTLALGTHPLSFGANISSNDISLSRVSAGIVGVGTGAAASTGGALELAGNISVGTKFTTSGGGCSVSSTAGGATAGEILVSTTGTCTTTITMNGATGLTAPNGWACSGNDMNTGAIVTTTATNATTATISLATTSGNTIIFSCVGF